MVRVLLLGVILCGCATLSERPKAYQEIRGAIATGVDASTGQTFASAEPAAKVDTQRSTMTYGEPDEQGDVSGVATFGVRSTWKKFFYAVKEADGGVQVFIETYSSRPVMETDLQDKPWPETDPKYGRVWIGTPWRETSRELVEFSTNCEGTRLNCSRVQRNRIKLSEEDVRALLSDVDRKDIPVGIYERSVDWKMPYDELLATLDALGVTERFR